MNKKEKDFIKIDQIINILITCYYTKEQLDVIKDLLIYMYLDNNEQILNIVRRYCHGK